jgi:adenylate cyclase
VIVGNFGTAERFAYTAMGDSVNLASRLESLNKAYGTYIIASAAVRDAADPIFEWQWLDRVVDGVACVSQVFSDRVRI